MLELKQIESFFPENLRHFKRNILREYLQYKILEIISLSSYGSKLIFMGGTAIHIAHGLPRFSEDLDFDNRGIGENDFTALVKVISSKLSLEGYNINTSLSFKGAYSADIKFTGLLFEAGLSGHRQENVLIKLDAEPQNFQYAAERFILNKFDVFAGINVVPVDILLAQKFYAILKRRRAVGRDFYDILFLSGKTAPNFAYLKERAGIANREELKRAVTDRCADLDFNLLAKDVEQFIFLPDDARKVKLFGEYIESLCRMDEL